MTYRVGIATLDVLTLERLIENAARTGQRLLQGLAAMMPRVEFLHDVYASGGGRISSVYA